MTIQQVPDNATTVGVYLKTTKRLYTYLCARPVKIGDWVNVKLPAGAILTVMVQEVHETPQLSDKWEIKWCVLIQTKEEYEAANEQASELGALLDLRGPAA